MKRLAVIGLLAACGDEASTPSLEFQITVTESGGSLALIDPSSECAREENPLEAGVCSSRSHTDADCPGLKATPGDCVYGLEFEGVTGVQFVRGGWIGNALGGTVLVKGCGEPIAIPLPTSVPTVPSGVRRIDADSGTEVVWTSDATVARVRLSSGYDTGGTVCHADASAGQFVLPSYGDYVSLQAESPATIVETRLGPAYVRAAARTAVLPQWPREIHVVASEQGGSFTTVNPNEPCAHEQYPIAIDTCVAWSDDMEPCYGLDELDEQCSFTARVDGVSGITVEGHHWQGNALGGTLVITGCGDPISIPLPTTAPAAPTGVMATVSGDATELIWDTNPTATAFAITRDDGLAGGTCRVDASTTSYVIDSATTLGITAESERTRVETWAGPAFVHAAATTEVPQP